MTDEVTIDGAKLAYAAAGPESGEPVLLLHGYFGSHATYRHQLDALSDDYRLVAPDWFGWGQSEVAPDAEYDHEVGRMAALVDELGWESFNLVGHDYGGFLGLGFAQQYPDRVRRLAILNSRAHGSFVPRWYAIFSAIVWTAWNPLTRWLLYLAPIETVHRVVLWRERRNGTIDRETWESHTANLGASSLGLLFRDYRLAPRPELREHLSDLEMPTAIIWGEDDRFMDLTIPRELAGEIPTATLDLLEETGHFVTEERPEVVTETLRELLEREI